jgi:hypothetical protein
MRIEKQNYLVDDGLPIRSRIPLLTWSLKTLRVTHKSALAEALSSSRLYRPFFH